MDYLVTTLAFGVLGVLAFRQIRTLLQVDDYEADELVLDGAVANASPAIVLDSSKNQTRSVAVLRSTNQQHPIALKTRRGGPVPFASVNYQRLSIVEANGLLVLLKDARSFIAHSSDQKSMGSFSLSRNKLGMSHMSVIANHRRSPVRIRTSGVHVLAGFSDIELRRQALDNLIFHLGSLLHDA